MLQEAPDVLLLHCSNCHGSSASRMPTPDALQNFYSSYYDNKTEKVTADAPDHLASHIFRICGKHVGTATGREFSLLDYGGGDGSIACWIGQALIEQGAEKVRIALVDYDQSTAETTGGRIEIFRPADLAQIPDLSMDLVIASAIVEHIPEPREILIRLLASLKPGGMFYARTPYVAPLSRLATFFNSSFDFTYPAHVHDLGPGFWNNMVSTLQPDGVFEVVRSTPSIVETSFRRHFLRTLAAHVLKLPGYVFKEHYGLVGGWEIFIRRLS